MNSKLRRCQDFNLTDAADREEIDKYLSDFVRMKSQEAHCDQILQYHDYKSEKDKTYVKIPVLTTGNYYWGAQSSSIDAVLDTLSPRDSDKTSTIRCLTKALLSRARSAVLSGLEEMNARVVQPMDAVTEVAMWKAGRT